MPAYFLDSSAVVKRCIQEPGSIWVRDLLIGTPVNEIVLSAITGVEVTAAIARRVRSGNTSQQDGQAALGAFHRHLRSQYQIVEVTHGILERAMQLAESRALRGYDAVQLATALEVGRAGLVNPRLSLTLVSADKELNAAAQFDGLNAKDPNTDP